MKTWKSSYPWKTRFCAVFRKNWTKPENPHTTAGLGAKQVFMFFINKSQQKTKNAPNTQKPNMIRFCSGCLFWLCMWSIVMKFLVRALGCYLDAACGSLWDSFSIRFLVGALCCFVGASSDFLCISFLFRWFVAGFLLFSGCLFGLARFFFQSDFLLGLTISSETVCAFFVVRLLVGLCVVIWCFFWLCMWFILNQIPCWGFELFCGCLLRLGCNSF